MSGKRVDLTWTAPVNTTKNLALDVYEIWGYTAGPKGSCGSPYLTEYTSSDCVAAGGSWTENPLTLLKTTGSTSYSEDVTWKIDAEPSRTFTIIPVDMADKIGGNKGASLDVNVVVPVPDRPGYGSCSILTIYTDLACTTAGGTWSDTKNFNSVVVDNNVLLRWSTSNNIDKLDIQSYEVKRCPNDDSDSCTMTAATWSSLVPVATAAGQFIAHMELISNDYKYGVVAIDSAGNYSPITDILATVNEPPDYVLQEEFISTMDPANPVPAVTPPEAPEETSIYTTNIRRGVSSALLPVTMPSTETWAAHFTTNGFNTFQDIIDAGYPYYLQPTPNVDATFWQKWDIQTALDASTVSLAISSTVLGGSISMAHTVYHRNTDPDPEGITDTTGWAALSGSSVSIGVPFRWIKVKTVFTGNPSTIGKNLMSLDEYRVKLSIKTISDSGEDTLTDNSGLCNDATTGNPLSSGLYDEDRVACGTAGGAWVSTSNGLKVKRIFFNKAFKDVKNIVGTIKLGVGDPVSLRAVIDFEDTPLPTHFYLHVIDTAVYSTGTYSISPANVWTWTDSITGGIKTFNGTATWNVTGTK
jgi:hypothetical protein